MIFIEIDLDQIIVEFQDIRGLILDINVLFYKIEKLQDFVISLDSNEIIAVSRYSKTN